MRSLSFLLLVFLVPTALGFEVCGVSFDPPYFEVNTVGGDLLLLVDANGDLLIGSDAVNLSTDPVGPFSSALLIWSLLTDTPVMAFTPSEANISGTINENQTVIPDINALPIHSADTVVAAFTASGDIYIAGTAVYNGAKAGCPPDSTFCGDDGNIWLRSWECNIYSGYCDKDARIVEVCRGTEETDHGDHPEVYGVCTVKKPCDSSSQTECPTTTLYDTCTDENTLKEAYMTENGCDTKLYDCESYLLDKCSSLGKGICLEAQYCSSGACTGTCCSSDSECSSGVCVFNNASISSVDVSNGLMFAPPHSDRYSHVLFNGEYSKVYVTVSVDSSSPFLDLNLEVTGACVEDNYARVNGPGTYQVETRTTTPMGECNITARLKYKDNTIDEHTITVPVWHISTCNSTATFGNLQSKTEAVYVSCSDRLLQSSNYYSGSDTNALVVLTSDIEKLSVPTGEYNGHVLFDGNGYTLVGGNGYTPAGSSGGVSVDINGDARHILLRNFVARGEIVVGERADIKLIDINSFDRIVARGQNETNKTVVSLSNCFIKTTQPIDVDLVKLTLTYCNIKLEAPYPTYSVIDCSFSDVNIYGSEIESNAHGVVCDNSSVLTIEHSVIDVNKYAVAQSGGSLSIRYSELRADEGALRIVDARAVIKESNIEANTEALSLSNTDVNIFSSFVYAEKNYAVSHTSDDYVHIYVHLSDGDVVITSPGYDWLAWDGIIFVRCEDCNGNYVLRTDLEDKYGTGGPSWRLYCSEVVPNQEYTCR